MCSCRLCIPHGSITGQQSQLKRCTDLGMCCVPEGAGVSGHHRYDTSAEPQGSVDSLSLSLCPKCISCPGIRSCHASPPFIQDNMIGCPWARAGCSACISTARIPHSLAVSEDTAGRMKAISAPSHCPHHKGVGACSGGSQSGSRTCHAVSQREQPFPASWTVLPVPATHYPLITKSQPQENFAQAIWPMGI